MLTIRLSRKGKKKQITYRLIISEKARDPYGRALEILGSYDPGTKILQAKQERINYWISKGAGLSGTVNNLLIKENIIKGDSILVYPEGTSHVFNGLHHFYPGSFEVAYENNFTIQPITIRYETDITWGIKTEYSQKYHYEMIENSKQCVKFDTNDVNVTFHAPIQANKFEDSSHLLNYVKYIITDEWIHQHHYINQNKIYNNINTQNIYTAVS